MNAVAALPAAWTTLHIAKTIDGGFPSDAVHGAAWDFCISGCQPAQGGLKGRTGQGGWNIRPGRTLTEANILRDRCAIVAMLLTIPWMMAMDATVEARDGWPAASAGAVS